jgi:hypothetical protein
MKKLLMIASVLMASAVFAEGDHSKNSDHEKSKPCLEIKKACEAGGFVKGDHKDGKGLYKDCMQKLANGETVVGVSVTPDMVSACKQKRDEHKERAEKRKEHKEHKDDKKDSEEKKDK